MQACCRALGGYLFGCLDDHEILPQTQRSLYGPSYEHYCTQDGHVALPSDFNSYVPHRFSAFKADKRWLFVRILPASVSAYYPHPCPHTTRMRVRMLLCVRIPVNADKRWLCVRMLPASVSAYYPHSCPHITRIRVRILPHPCPHTTLCVRMLLCVRIPVYVRPHLEHLRTAQPQSLQRSQEVTAVSI
jgi:hypothetical protein